MSVPLCMAGSLLSTPRRRLGALAALLPELVGRRFRLPGTCADRCEARCALFRTPVRVAWRAFVCATARALSGRGAARIGHGLLSGNSNDCLITTLVGWGSGFNLLLRSMLCD